MGTERVVVVGGGVGGLSTALALGRAGHEVTILERDVLPETGTAEEAFAAERQGAPQVHQTHGFLARLVVELREHFPDVLDAMFEAGCTTMPGMAQLGDPQPGDEDLQVLIVRRTTFEWILRSKVAEVPSVTTRMGAGVSALVVDDSEPTPRVRGVRLDDGTEVAADVVVAATGRRGPVGRWLADAGIEIEETVVNSGLVYLSRWYRLGDEPEIPVDAKLGGDLGFVKFLGVPGDGGTLSITLAVRSDDRELRSLLADADNFETACRNLPGPDIFFRDGPLEPLGGVRPMGGLLNRLRRFTDHDGAPLLAGFHVVGDAHTCTNPLYGRGCALALVEAIDLAEAFAAHPDDPVERGRVYEATHKREIEPWYDLSVQMDKMGADPAGFGRGDEGTEEPSDPGAKAMGAVFAAAATDPVIGRALARFMNLLATPADLMVDPAVMARMAEVMANPDDYPPPPRVGPRRSELIDLLTATDVDAGTDESESTEGAAAVS